MALVILFPGHICPRAPITSTLYGFNSFYGTYMTSSLHDLKPLWFYALNPLPSVVVVEASRPISLALIFTWRL